MPTAGYFLRDFSTAHWIPPCLEHRIGYAHIIFCPVGVVLCRFKLGKVIKGYVSSVLASAISSKTDYLVTGDKEEFNKPGLKGQYGFQILGPSEFVEKILPEILRSINE